MCNFHGYLCSMDMVVLIGKFFILPLKSFYVLNKYTIKQYNDLNKTILIEIYYVVLL